MSKKINTNEFVNKEFLNKKGEKYKITEFLFKEKNNYCFNAVFLKTKNTQMLTLNQIRRGTGVDLEERKKIKRLETEQKLKERNKLIAKTKKTFTAPQGLEKKRILSIDLASKSTGIAFAVYGKIVRWKTIKSNLTDFRARGQQIISEIVEIILKGKIDLVILEDIYLGLNSNILIMLSEIRGMLSYHLQKHNIELILVPAVFWKNRCGDVPFTRQEQKKYMINKFFELTGVEADSDDSADAYMMLWGLLNA